MNTTDLAVVGGIIVTTAGTTAAAALISTTGRVGHIEHAKGTHPALRGLLRGWDSVGTHEVDVAPADTDWTPTGGLRTSDAEEAAAAAAGLSHATTLSQSPHGRGCALDVWPRGFNPRRGFDSQPGMEQMMRLFGEWAQNQAVTVDGVTYTFTWGGSWKTLVDLPHVELKGWQHMPFPPPDYGEGFV